MPIPIILGAVGVGSAIAGIAGAISGKKKSNEAKKLFKEANQIIDRIAESLNPKIANTNENFDRLGRVELEIFNSFKFISEISEKINNFNDIDFKEHSVNGYSIPKFDPDEVRKIWNFAATLSDGMSGIAAGTIGGLAARGMTVAAVSAFGTAGTGAAIAGLHGIAATNAILAFLGGGTLASGGAGIAHGARLLDDTKSGVWRVVGGCVLLCTGLKNLKNEKNRYEKICNSNRIFRQFRSSYLILI